MCIQCYVYDKRLVVHTFGIKMKLMVRYAKLWPSSLQHRGVITFKMVKKFKIFMNAYSKEIPKNSWV